MDLKQVLNELGVNRSKADVYLACLELGRAKVSVIANKAGVPRTTANEILEQLAKKGLIIKIRRGRTLIFEAESPTKLKLLLKEQEHRLDEAMPELKLLFNTAGIRPRIRFYEGVEGIKEVLKDTLTVKNKILRGILSMEDLYQIPGKKFMDEYVSKRIANGIRLQVIRSELKEVGETWPSSQKENRELRYAPMQMIFPMTLYLYDNKVGVIGTKKENFGIIIDSEDFYHTLKNFFEITWEVGKIGKKVD